MEVINRGGIVLKKGEQYRINGELKLSRSFGDRHLKHCMSSTPDLYRFPATGLRFFTVYGPWGRPDMAIFKFVRAVIDGQPIDVYNHGDMLRDFTYVDDVVDAVVRVLGQSPVVEPLSVPHQVLNVGNNGPVPLLDFIACIEKATGLPAVKNLLPMQAGDVPKTWADTTALQAGYGLRPHTDLRVGVQRFVDWYRDYYGLPVKT